MKIVLISCTSKKQNFACEAKLMYQKSDLFAGAYKYAHQINADKIFILSAKYGLLTETDIIEPYNETLKTKKVAEIKIWAETVLAKLSTVTSIKNDDFVFLAGKPYRRFLVPYIKHYSVPLEHLGIGKQLSFYKRENSKCQFVGNYTI